MRKFTLFLFLIIILVISGFFLTKETKADSINHNVSGFAWSENIGWISFNCYNEYDGGALESHCTPEPGYTSDYGVKVDLNTTGNFSGYAWSEHIGWIWFDSSGPYPEAPNYSACLDIPDEAGEVCDGVGDNLVSGWARACAVFADPNLCSGALDPNRGDWDGWIKLRGTAGVPTCVNPDWKCDHIDGPPMTGAKAYININQVTGEKWISYKTLSPESLKAAHYVGTGGNCGNGEWECEMVDDYQSGNFSSGKTSLAFDSSNNPWIVYVRHNPTGAIMIARYVGTGGTGCINSTNPGAWNCEIVEEGAASAYPELVFDQSGTTWISYERGNVLNVAQRVASGGSGCDGADNPNLWTCEKVDVNGWSEQGDSSIKIDSSGQILIVFRGIDLNVSPRDYGVLLARHVGSGGSGCINSDNPSEWSCELIEKYPSDIAQIGSVRLALGSSDEPWVTFYGPDEDIIVARHVGSGGSGCINSDNPSEWTCSVLDAGWSQSLPAFPIRSSSGDIWVVYRRSPDSNIWLGKFVGSGGNCKGSEWDCELIDSHIVVESFSSALDPFGNLWFTKFTGITLWVVHYSPPPPDYGVSLNTTPDPNEFEGWAWSDMNIGWVSFNHLNCDSDNDGWSDQGNYSQCPVGIQVSDYKVFITTPVNQAPSAINLNVTNDNYCGYSSPPIWLNWEYSDPDDVPPGTDPQSAYQIEIDTNASFPLPRGCPLAGDGKVISSSESCHPVGLNWDETYWWRVMVWDSFNSPSVWANGSFTTFPEPPRVNFFCNGQDDCSTVSVSEEEIVILEDTSTCPGAGLCSSRTWTLPPGATIVNPDPPDYTFSPIEVIFQEGPNQPVNLYIEDANYPAVTGYSCDTTENLNVTLPLPEWKEIAPVGLLERFLAFVFNFFQV